MGDVVNLRMARKVKARRQKEDEAAANRARFGRPKAERLKSESEQERSARALDGHRRENADAEE